MTRWAARIPGPEASKAGSLRLRPGVDACETQDALWLRGGEIDDSLDLAIRKIPGVTRFAVSDGGRLTEAGSRVPKGRLPERGWVALSAWVSLDPQPAALPGEIDRRVALRLVRSDGEREPEALVTDIRAWVAFAEEAPTVRLKPLAFAVAPDGRVLVRGTPLPPIAGRRYVHEDGIAIPCGFTWSPPVEPAILRELLDLGPGDLALFEDDGAYERIDAGGFVRASRSAARLSLRGL